MITGTWFAISSREHPSLLWRVTIENEPYFGAWSTFGGGATLFSSRTAADSEVERLQPYVKVALVVRTLRVTEDA